MKRYFILLIAAFLCFVLFGCNAEPESSDIAATTLPVYEFTAFLCQNTDITVSRLVTENISCLHDYSLQVKQMRIIEQADLVIISGAGLEDFLEDALHTANAVVDASNGIDLLGCGDEHAYDHNDGHDHAIDPHIWLSPENAKKMSQTICAKLIEKHPAYTDIFTKNLASLVEKFDALQAYANEQLATVSTRELITFHDGFAYMADAFDLTILHAIEEESGSEASAAELIELIGIVNDHNVNAIFTEKNSSSSGASVIAAETGATIYQLDMALSGDSYFASMYHNIDTLKEALK